MSVEGHIRPIVESDLKVVVAIERESFIDPWPISWFRAAIVCRDHFAGYFIDGDRLAGYALSVFEEGSLHIANLVVDSNYRCRGIGKALLEEAIRFGEIHGASTAFLEVRASNEQAIKLYKSLDFELARTEESYYGDGENALILARKLNGVV